MGARRLSRFRLGPSSLLSHTACDGARVGCSLSLPGPRPTNQREEQQMSDDGNKKLTLTPQEKEAVKALKEAALN